MKSFALIIITAILTLLGALVAFGVQPFPGGVRINWDRATNDLSFYVWRLNPPSTNWQFLGATTNTTFLYTNQFPDGTMFGITANQKFGNNICCVAADVGVAGWPPSISTPQKTIRLTPTNGYTVETGKWVKVSSDLVMFSDWMKFGISGTNVNIEAKTSPLKPYLFMMYPTNPSPPFP